METFGDKVKNFFRRLFPPELAKYVPGQKFVAGLLVYGITEAFGLDSSLVTLPVVGEVNINELATLAAVYFWPFPPSQEDEPVVKRKRNRY